MKLIKYVGDIVTIDELSSFYTNHHIKLPEYTYILLYSSINNIVVMKMHIV